MDFQGHFPMREWNFCVEGATAPGEIMCVIGSCKELGEWKPENVVPMQIAAAGSDVAGGEVNSHQLQQHIHDVASSPTYETNRNTT